MKASTVFLLVLLCLVGLPTFGVHAQGPVDESAFLHLMPELRTAAAPNWVRPGVRITYYSAFASIPGARHYYHEDENGNWIDPQTGQRYRQADIPGPAGHGYTQVNVVWLDRSVAAMDIWSYGVADASGRIGINAVVGIAGLPGAGGDWWLNPQVVRRYPDRQTPGLRVLRMPYVIDGRRFRAVRFQTVSGSGFMAWNFDEDTGVLLRTSSSAKGAPIQGPLAPGDSREGSTLLTQTTLRGVRTLNVPWALQPAPSWVSQVRLLRYEGKTAVQLPGAPSMSWPMSATLERQFAGTNWARYLQTTVSANNTSQGVRVFGPAQFGGLWVPPAAFGHLRSGQVLDTDPLTGVVTSVGQIGRSPQGRDVVGIAMTGSGFHINHLYDRRDGVLVYVGQVAHTVHMQFETWLTSRQ